MRIGIFYHKKNVPQSVVESIVTRIKEQGATPVLLEEGEIAGVDRLLVLGGDGTILHTAISAAKNNIPLLGVNYGTRGFLAEFEREETLTAVDFILNPENRAVVKRSMLNIGFRGENFLALNELSILHDVEKANKFGTLSFEVDGLSAGEFVADGLIIATPTGSTAYSLSAGGSILAPDCNGIIFTPICAFSMRSRPLICSDRSAFTLTVTSPQTAFSLHADGRRLGTAKEGDRITIQKSECYAVFLTKDKSEFFRRLTKKIN